MKMSLNNIEIGLGCAKVRKKKYHLKIHTLLLEIDLRLILSKLASIQLKCVQHLSIFALLPFISFKVKCQAVIIA